MNQTAIETAVKEWLANGSEHWVNVDADELTDSESKAMSLLTAAGMVERRITFSVRLAGQNEAVEATFDATGENGIAEALEPLVTDLFARWGNAWQSLRESVGDGAKFFCELKQQQMRLTDQGMLAKDDLKQGEQTPLDFVFRKGFFDEQRRMLPDGRIVGRLPVAGSGRLVKIAPANATQTPLQISIANTTEFAESLKAAFANGLPTVGIEKQTEVMLQIEPPKVDELEPDTVVNWFGKRLYLGKDTICSKLFWLLVRPIGLARTNAEVQRAIDGYETTEATCDDKNEIKKANNRVRKAVWELREKLREFKIDKNVALYSELVEGESTFVFLYKHQVKTEEKAEFDQ